MKYRVEINFFNDNDIEYEREYLSEKNIVREFATLDDAKEFLESQREHIKKIVDRYAVSDCEKSIVDTETNFVVYHYQNLAR